MLTVGFLRTLIGYISGGIVFLGFFLYLKAILERRVISNKASWGVWTVVTGILCVSYYLSVGFVSTIWVSVAYFICTFLVFISLYKYSVSTTWGWAEKTTLASSLLVVIFLITHHSPLIALNLTMLIDAIGAIPLIRSAYLNPRGEYGPAWYLGFSANILNLFALQDWNYANSSYPLYLALLTFIISFLIYFPNFFRGKYFKIYESIPEFPKFKPLELNDCKEVEKMTEKFLPYSDFNFVSLWSWNLINEISLSKLHGNLVVKFTDYITYKPFYSFIGDQNINETVADLLKFCEQNGLPCKLSLVPEQCLVDIDKNKFELNENRDHFDYIYSIEELREYPGSKFIKKRNHVNSFLNKYPQAVARTISLKDKKTTKRVLRLFKKWYRLKIQKGIKSEAHDLDAMKRLLRGVNVFNLIVVGVFIEKKIVAVIVNQLINREYVVAHMMKADTSIAAGVYAFLMQKNASILSLHHVKFFNYEQDLGIENLRIAKERFFPQFFLKKYDILPKMKILNKI